VSNGGQWGDWKDPEFCPEGQFAIGYDMKVCGQQLHVTYVKLIAKDLFLTFCSGVWVYLLTSSAQTETRASL